MTTRAVIANAAGGVVIILVMRTGVMKTAL
jgi:hypothetical protein